MTTKTKDPTVARRCPSPLVLFGIDSRGKPKAARFGKEHASLAMKAATQLQLNVLASSNPKIAEIAARLPVGRVHATGRMFVPFIRHDLYDKLVAAAANGNTHSASPPNGSSGASGSTPGGSAPHLPRNWREIGVGDLVVANQDRDEGWYEAIVVEQSGDMFTLRWRDYPRERRTVHHRLRLGLVYPGPRPTAENGKSTKASGQTKRDKPFAVDPAPNHSLPKDWDEIDINHLVLAKDDSQWGAWWEAIPVEKAGDLFKLRWREKYATNVGLITRSRLDLALLCPDAASRSVDRSGLQQVRACPWPADQISAEQAAARGPSPTQTIFPFARPRTALRVTRDVVSGRASPLQETTMTTKTKAIRALNDELRQNFTTGTAVMTAGVAALGAEAVARIVKTIGVYDDFCHANDPYEEHDFGSFEVDGHTVFFKIDYFDKSRSYHSPDPSDPSVTERVITIMLAEEY